MFTAAILAATVILGPQAIVMPRPVIGTPVILQADIVVWGGCDFVRNISRKPGEPRFIRMTVVEVENASSFAVGLGTRVTFPDVHDDGTLSVNGIAEYAIFAPGDRKTWSSEIPHAHLTVRYRPFPGNEGDEILEKDIDAVCP